MTVPQISVFLDNKPGALALFTDVLREHKLDMRALSLVETAEFGILRVIMPEPDRALEVIRNAGFICSVTRVLVLCISDQAGSFSGAVNVLGKTGFNVEYCYAITAREQGNAYMVLRVDDTSAAARALTDAGFNLCCIDQL